MDNDVDPFSGRLAHTCSSGHGSFGKHESHVASGLGGAGDILGEKYVVGVGDGNGV